MGGLSLGGNACLVSLAEVMVNRLKGTVGFCRQGHAGGEGHKRVAHSAEGANVVGTDCIHCVVLQASLLLCICGSPTASTSTPGRGNEEAAGFLSGTSLIEK